MAETLQRPEGASARWAVIHRQPIFDTSARISGYELLLHDACAGAGAPAAAELVAGAFAEVGLRRLVRDREALLTLPLELLALASQLGLPAEHLVLGIGERLVDERLLSTAGELVEHGFRIAVGGWSLEAGAEPLLSLASIVTVPFAFGTEQLRRLTARAEELHARGVTLLASGVQTRGEYEEARRLGFDAFQGQYLAQPESAATRRTPTFRASVLAEILDANGPDAFERLERAILQDAGLANRVLRLVDSAAYPARTRVGSIRHALARLGAEPTRRWALILLLAGLVDAEPQSAARHLLGLGLHRGRLCELLARDAPGASSGIAFTVGLLSVLPGLLGRPIGELAGELPLSARLIDALLDYQGPEGHLLAAVVAYEDGARERGPGPAPLLAAITRIYTGALLWAEETVDQVR